MGGDYGLTLVPLLQRPLLPGNTAATNTDVKYAFKYIWQELNPHLFVGFTFSFDNQNDKKKSSLFDSRFYAVLENGATVQLENLDLRQDVSQRYFMLCLCKRFLYFSMFRGEGRRYKNIIVCYF